MNRTKLTLCFAVLLFTYTSATAQLLNIKIGSDALVEDAIKDAVVIVEAGYCLQDTGTGQKYGRNGKPRFNTLQFLGCKTQGRVMVGESILRPWDSDELFDKYRNESKYRPLSDKTWVVCATQTAKRDTIDIAKADMHFSNDSSVVWTNVGRDDAAGLRVTEDDVDGIKWIVWIREIEKAEADSLPRLEYVVVKNNTDISAGSVVEAPNLFYSYLGGLYISSRIVSTGLVEFSLTGIAVKKGDNWMVVPINVTPINNDNTIRPDNSLTPIEEKKKKPKISKKK